MGLDVSDELNRFQFWLSGEQFPATDEDKLRQMAEVLKTLGIDIEALQPDFVAAVNSISENMTGEADRAFVDAMREYIDEPGFLPLAGRYVNRFGDDFADTATEVEFAKLMIIATLIELLIEFTIALALSWLFPGLMQSFLLRLLVGRSRVISWLIRILVQIGVAQVAGVGMQVLMVLIVQAIQIRDGSRKDIDWEKVRKAAEVGSLGGIMHVGVGGLFRALGPQFGKFLNRGPGEAPNGRHGPDLDGALPPATKAGHRDGPGTTGGQPPVPPPHHGGHGYEIAASPVSEGLTEGVAGVIYGQGWDWQAVWGGAASGLTSTGFETLGDVSGGKLRHITHREVAEPSGADDRTPTPTVTPDAGAQLPTGPGSPPPVLAADGDPSPAVAFDGPIPGDGVRGAAPATPSGGEILAPTRSPAVTLGGPGTDPRPVPQIVHVMVTGGTADDLHDSIAAWTDNTADGWSVQAWAPANVVAAHPSLSLQPLPEHGALAVLHEHGGVLVDAGLSPAGITLPAQPVLMGTGPADVPYLGAALHSDDQLHSTAQRLAAEGTKVPGTPAELRRNPDALQAAYGHALDHRGPRLIMSPPGTPFLAQLTAQPAPDRPDAVSAMNSTVDGVRRIMPKATDGQVAYAPDPTLAAHLEPLGWPTAPRPEWRRWAPEGDAEAVFAGRYGWLAQVNDGGHRDLNDQQWARNCFFTAVATHMTLIGDLVFTAPGIATGDPGFAQGVVMVDVVNYANSGVTEPRRLLQVASADTIAEAVGKAGPGAHGLAIFRNAAGRLHVVNVFNDGDGVLFLDGQSGRSIVPPAGQQPYFIAAGDIDVTPAGTAVVPTTLGPVGSADGSRAVETTPEGPSRPEAEPATPPNLSALTEIEVGTDGDCLFHAILRSAYEQGVTLPSWVPAYRDDTPATELAAAFRRNAAERMTDADAVPFGGEQRTTDTLLDELEAAETSATDQHLRNPQAEAELRKLITDGLSYPEVMRQTLRRTVLWNTPAGDFTIYVLARMLDVNIALKGLHAGVDGIQLGEHRPWLALHRVNRSHYEALAPKPLPPLPAAAPSPGPPSPDTGPTSTRDVVIETPVGPHSLLHAVIAAAPRRVLGLGGFDEAQSAWLRRVGEVTAPEDITALFTDAHVQPVTDVLIARVRQRLAEPGHREALDRLVRTNGRTPNGDDRRQSLEAVRHWLWDDEGFGNGFALAVTEVLGLPLEVRTANPDPNELWVSPPRTDPDPIVLREPRPGRYDAVLVDGNRSSHDNAGPAPDDPRPSRLSTGRRAVEQIPQTLRRALSRKDPRPRPFGQNLLVPGTPEIPLRTLTPRPEEPAPPPAGEPAPAPVETRTGPPAEPEAPLVDGPMDIASWRRAVSDAVRVARTDLDQSNAATIQRLRDQPATDEAIQTRFEEVLAQAGLPRFTLTGDQLRRARTTLQEDISTMEAVETHPDMAPERVARAQRHSSQRIVLANRVQWRHSQFHEAYPRATVADPALAPPASDAPTRNEVETRTGAPMDIDTWRQAVNNAVRSAHRTDPDPPGVPSDAATMLRLENQPVTDDAIQKRFEEVLGQAGLPRFTLTRNQLLRAKGARKQDIWAMTWVLTDPDVANPEVDQARFNSGQQIVLANIVTWNESQYREAFPPGIVAVPPAEPEAPLAVTPMDIDAWRRGAGGAVDPPTATTIQPLESQHVELTPTPRPPSPDSDSDSDSSTIRAYPASETETIRPYRAGDTEAIRANPAAEIGGADAAAPPAATPETPPEVPVESGPPTEEAPPDPGGVPAPGSPRADARLGHAVRGVGTPRDGIPGMAEFLDKLGQTLARHNITVAGAQLTKLAGDLLPRYRYLVADGWPHDVGGAEVRFTLELREPELDVDSTPEPKTEDRDSTTEESKQQSDEDDFRSPEASQLTKGDFQTGGHSGGQSHQASAYRGGVSASVGFGVAPTALQNVRIGTGFTLVANAVTRGTSHGRYAEQGRVLDVRTTQSVLSYGITLRAHITLPGTLDPLPTPVAHSPRDRLKVLMPWHLLMPVPAGLVRAAQPESGTKGEGPDLVHIPQTFYTIQTTGLVPLGRSIAEKLDLKAGTQARRDLLEGLEQVSLHLEPAIEGHAFWLYGDARRTTRIAQVTVIARRVEGGDRRHGVASDEAHIEKVRTAVVSDGDSQSSESSITPSVFAEASVVPVPGLSLGPKAEIAYTAADVDTVDSGRGNLRVQVSRYTGRATTHGLTMMFEARIETRNSPGDSLSVKAVRGESVVTVSEAEAFSHGFEVDREAFRDPPVTATGTTVPFDPSKIRFTGQDDQPETKPTLPGHIERGLLGQVMVELERDAARELRKALRAELSRHGFLVPRPDLPFQKQPHERVLINGDRMANLVSKSGFEAFMPEMMQDGTSLTLTVHEGGVNRSARVTVYARLRPDTEAGTFVLRTGDLSSVYLAMGTAGHGQGMGGQHKWAWALSLVFGQSFVSHLKSISGGVRWERYRAAMDRVSTMTNKPTLMEYPGSVDKHHLPIELWATVDYGDATPRFVSPRITKTAQLHVLPHFDTPTTPPQELRGSVLTKGVLPHVGTRGLTAAAREMLPELTGPGKPADQEVSNFLSPISVLPNLAAVLQGRYSRQLSAPGLIREKRATIAVSGRPISIAYAGSTPDKYVSGQIDLGLFGGSQVDSQGRGRSVTPLRIRPGGAVDSPGLSGLEGGGDFSYRRGSSIGHVETYQSGVEYLNLNFHSAVAFQVVMDLFLAAAYERNGKLGWNTARRSAPRRFANLEAMVIFPKPVSLNLYAAGHLPMPPAALADVLGQWSAQKQALTGNAVAGALVRWHLDQLIGTMTDRLGPERQEWARELVQRLSTEERLSVRPQTGRWFTQMFGLALPARADPFAGLLLPQYLTAGLFGRAAGPQRNPLGFAVVQDIVFNGGHQLVQVVQDAIDKVHPGALARPVRQWDDHEGAVTGSLLSGTGLVDATFAGNRFWPLFNQMNTREGYSISFFVPNGALGHILKVNVSSGWTSMPEVTDLLEGTGIEQYLHGHWSNKKTIGRSHGFGIGNPALNMSGDDTVRDGEKEDKTPDVRGGVAATVSTGQNESAARADVSSQEQTAYEHNAGYVAQSDFQLRVTVSRHERPKRPVMNKLNRVVTLLTRRPDVEAKTLTGRAEIRLPKALLEAKPFPPSLDIDLTAVGRLPGDAIVFQVIADDAAAIGNRLVAGLPPGADNKRAQLPTSLVAKLQTSGLASFLPAALQPNGAEIASKLYDPGRSKDPTKLTLEASLFDLHGISLLNGTGTGRYAKGQTGNESNVTTDTVAVSGNFSTGGDPRLSELDPQHVDTPYGKDSMALTMSGAHSLAPHNNFGRGGNGRIEDHLKQVGPTVFARARLLARLTAGEQTHLTVAQYSSLTAEQQKGAVAALNGPGHSLGGVRSEYFGGEVFLLIHADEFHQLTKDIAERRPAPERLPSPSPAAVRESAHRIDLDRLFDDEAGLQPDGGLALGRIAQQVRRQLRQGQTVVLETAPDVQNRKSHGWARAWARERIRSEYGRTDGDLSSFAPLISKLSEWRRTGHTPGSGEGKQFRADVEKVLPRGAAYPMLAYLDEKHLRQLAALVAKYSRAPVWLRILDADGSSRWVEVDHDGRYHGPTGP
ncbi:toxin glutamine deamidase domain-containing protein [Paractinoplanes atraurantiacus]|uniref:OTU domain-containing protein n=1 Tax=Paractinoplanes atraurantiacus TaxID=1036182 RepID=A0A285KB17_9ACTN|nr:toxin glutamine deamidase domain-containing protein [Actinoplanes atraurantiacus]SNY69795.1 hypothetical protein SAMN05421748_13612 [Actinoplanes atraurantiacus]